ncbi:MAG: glycoside hydrolase family 3 C-terminal domain-containing protein, partial [Bifidobacteriaceae bacterium]|nr:glycoside hydrolase family 3 C-terminal domain-containing protein [Bifidobacteriaceae bacterium]
GGVFQVHLDSADGPVVATVPAEGANSDCGDDGSAPGTKNGTVALSQSLQGIHDLYFVYDNGTLGDFGQQGTPGHPYAYSLDAAAEQKIAEADAVIVVVGTTNAESAEEMDRVNIELPRFQDEVVNKVAALNKHTVVWMQSVGTMDIEKFRGNPNVPSIVWTNYNGQHQSITAANILFGRTNPSGKLPMTWYADGAELGSVWDYGLTPATSATGLGRTYQYFIGDVAYPFGYGLSYSSFQYSNLRLDKSSYSGDDTITATVDVTNTSPVAGKETVELYVSAPGADGVERPLRQLKGFEKVSLNPAQTKAVSIEVPADELWFWDEAADKQIWDLGKWVVQVGPSSASGLKTNFTLASAPTLTLDVVKAVPDATVLNTAAPGNKIHANLSATRGDLSFYDLADPALRVEYTVADPDVATVNADGVVSPVGAGLTTVTATVTADGVTKSDSFPVVVEDENAGPVIALSDKTATVANLGAANAEVKLLPEGATAAIGYQIAPMDENTAGATIDPVTGALTATGPGKVRITAIATITNGSDTTVVTQSAEINVVEPINVEWRNRPAPTASGQVGQGVALPALAATASDGAALAYSAVGLPAGVTLDSATGAFAGAPRTAGNFTVTVTASAVTDSDNYVAATANFVLTVAPAPPAQPIRVSWTAPPASAITLQVDEPVTLPRLAAAAADGAAVNYSATGLPPGLTLNRFTGVISGRPSAAGSHTVTVTATAAVAPANYAAVTATFTVQVTAVAPPVPVVVSWSGRPTGSVAGQVGVPVVLPALAAVAADGAAVVYSASGLPAGVVLDAATGVFSGVPAVAGSYAVTVTATGALEGVEYAAATGVFTLEVAPAAPPPYDPKYDHFRISPDLTGDGRGEVVALDGAGGVFRFDGTAAGGIGAGVRVLSGLSGHTVSAPGDWSGDGKADLLSVAPNGDMLLYVGDG